MSVKSSVAGSALAAACVVGAFSSGVFAQEKDAPPAPAAVQWFATWEQGAREAKRTGRPILLVAAAPHCHEISGLW